MTKNRPLQFGRLARDSVGKVIDAATAFITMDAGSLLKSSPLNYSTTILVLQVPDNARQLTLYPTTALRVSEDPAMLHWDTAAAGVKELFDVSLMQYVYIVRDTADGQVRFRFTTV